MDKIFCFGASITFGRGEQPSLGWCGRLKKEFESKARYNVVYNQGIPGDTSKGLKERMGVELSARKGPGKNDTTRIIIAVGTNDLATKNSEARVPLEQYKENISACVEIAKEWTQDVFILEIPPMDEAHTLNWEGYTYSNANREQYNAVLEHVCKAHGIHFISIDWGKGWHLKLEDGVHPNTEGYELMYQQIKQFFF